MLGDLGNDTLDRAGLAMTSFMAVTALTCCMAVLATMWLDGGTGVDTLFGGAGDTVYGGSSAGDIDVLNLTAYGWSNVNILPDPMNPLNGIIQILDPTTHAVIGTLTYYNIEKLLVCFAADTRILAEHGEVAVQDLVAGDRVRTRDHGLQTLRWVGRRDLGLGEMIAGPHLRPIQISAGALGQGLPLQDLVVSPQHRLLMSGWRAEMLFGEGEVLVAATHLTHLKGIKRLPAKPVSYFHLLFDAHEIVLSNGLWSESFQPAQRSLDAMDAPQREEVLQLFPELGGVKAHYPAARPTLKGFEAKVLLPG